ncbi:MAG: BREX-1 system phosphatase PglZ type B, partial [Gammaproteobacteria bacterium]
MVELQYRGVCWTQRNGRDWTVEAFLVSEDGGLGLDVARDARSRRSTLVALSELATTSAERLKGKHFEAEDFDKLICDDPPKDLLRWLSDPQTVRSEWNAERWSAFKSRCKAEFKFDPDKDGGLVGAERLGKREGSWETVWARFSESPVLYPGVPELLRKAMPSQADLLSDPSPWPQRNEDQEATLRQALLNLEKIAPSAARQQILALETTHS